jgi:hypothetical protein
MQLPRFLAPKRESPEPLSPTIKRPRRTLDIWTEVNEQVNSPLMELPAEVRNQIYSCVFTTLDDGTRPETSPLALLLTCRKLNLETSALAFSTHTFLVHGDVSFHALRQRTSILPDPHFNAITSVSFTPQLVRRMKGDSPSDVEFLSNAILLLPNLSRICVRTIKDAAHPDVVEGWHARKFWIGLDEISSGVKARMWKPGEGWSWRYADDDVEKLTCVDAQRRRRYIAPDPATGVVDRYDAHVENCAAVLDQMGTGRRVQVYMRLVEGSHVGERARFVVRLVSGLQEGIAVEEVGGRSGMVGYRYDPGEMYWGDLKNRNMLTGRGEVDRGRDEEVPRVVMPWR